VAGPSSREDSPQGPAPAESSSAVTSGAVTGIPAIVVLLALGLILRLIIAYVLLPGSGFPTDLSSFQYWANDIAQHGSIGFYDRTGFIDYPPVYMLLLGVVSFLTGGNIGEGVKLIPIFADLGLAATVWLLAVELGVNSRRAFIAALIILVNPITWFNSAIWGQADAVGSIFLLLGLRELQKDHRESASALAVLAVLTKLQLGILGFVVGFVILRRSLAPKTGEPDPERILSSLGAGLVTAALICIPFTGLDLLGAAGRVASAPGFATLAVGLVAGLGVFSLARRYLPLAVAGARTLTSVLLGLGAVVVSAGMVFDSIVSHLLGSFGEYPFLTLNAYNPWALLTNEHGNALDRDLQWWVLHDSPWTDASSGQSGVGHLIGSVPATVIVIALIAAALLLLAAAAARLSSHGEASPLEATDVDPDDASAGPGIAGWLRAEFSGLWGTFVVGAVVAAAVGLLGISGQHIYAAVLGDSLLLTVLILVSVWAAWRDDAQSLLVALTILAIAFFVVPTRAHERYLFPFFGLGAVLLAVSWRWSVTYVILAVVNTVNLLAVLVEYNGIPAGDGTLAGTLNDWGHGIMTAQWFDGIIWPVALCSVTTGLAMVWALLQLRGRAVAALEREVATAASEPESGGWWYMIGPLDGYAAEAGPADGYLESDDLDVLSASAVGVSAAQSVDFTDEGQIDRPGGGHDRDFAEGDDCWADGPEDRQEADRPRYVPAWVMALWHRLARPSTQPDRSAALDSEPHGRLTRQDIWVVVALVIAVLSIRVYRLDEPMQMYFDEVYHARTATEFLQDWRYNIPHDIYEWTHPHLAKYAIAGGITLFSDDKVTATGELDATVKDALVQPRTATSPVADPNNPDAASESNRYGDRLFTATGSEVRVYDLQTRGLVHTYSIPGASAFSEVGPTGLVYVGTSSGRIYRIDTNSLDQVQNGLLTAPLQPVEMDVDAGLSIARLYTGSPPFILAVDGTGNIVSIDLSQGGGTIVARGLVPGAADFSDLGTGGAALIRNPSTTTPTTTPTTPTTSPSAPAEAQALASAMGIDASAAQAALDAASTAGLPQAVDVGAISSDQVTSIQGLIAQGDLPDLQIVTSDPQALVAYASGLGTLDLRHLVVTSTLPTDEPATSIAINYSDFTGSGVRGDQNSYVAAGKSILLIRIDASTTPWSVVRYGNQTLDKMPGTITKVVFDRATRLFQALGRTPDGTGWTVYAIESNGDAVFSDARLPFEPVAIGLDSAATMQDVDREQIMALSSTGSMATVDVGQFAFSWRIVGVLFGALMAACLYLLARILFRRRSIGLLVALFTLADGMFFAQSRIAMNDTYVGGFLLLAYLIFAVLWLKVWKSRAAFWLGMPVLGVVLGLALASKWVAVYAMASIGILILLRSALGRLVTILGLAAGTGVLGWMAIAEMTTEPNTGNPAGVLLLIGLALAVVVGGFVWAMATRTTPDKVFIGVVTAVVAAGLFGAGLAMSPGTMDNGAPNYTFFILMLAATAISAAVNAYHPIAWTREEFQFAIGAPLVVGALAGLVGALRGSGLLIEVGLGGMALGALAAGAFWFGGTLGFGPLAAPPGPNDPARFAGPPSPAPEGWLRLGTGFGLHAAWMTACVLLLPIVIYVAFYLPWDMPWQTQTDATGALPTIACWHFDTTQGRCDDSWPAPGHTGQTLWDLTIQMYNYHNDLRATHAASSPWWAWPMDLKPVWFESVGYGSDTGSWIHDGGNPALWWLAIVAMVFICWQAFKRRSLGLTLIAVAFFWQWLSWSRIDRAAFQYHFYTALPFFLLALAYFMAELWHGPSRRTWLLARVAGAAALLFPAAIWLLKDPLCGLARVSTTDYFGNTICGSGTGDVNIETRILLIGIVLVLALAALAMLLWRLERRQNAGLEDRYWVIQLLVPVVLAGVLLWWLGQYGPRDSLFRAPLPPSLISIAMLLVGVLLAVVCLTARNPRRFVLGVCIFGIVAFVALYPDLSALPMPNAILGIYDGVMPTWFYGFQFSDNLQAASSVKVIGTWPLALTMLALLVAGLVAWAAWERRIVIGFRRAKLLSGATEIPPATVVAAVPGPESAGSSGDPVPPRPSRKDKPIL
jgi:4-amino-4-deoxy-L-arabinose transferase-like glycosyltransferase